MQSAPIPSNEKERLESLYKLKILDTPPEERFDRITKLATYIFQVPISTISLVDSNREWFKSCQGLSRSEEERAISFCGHAMLTDGIFIIPDALKDPRFADNPMVAGEPRIRFYAGVPLTGPDGLRVGTFCIKDRQPRQISKVGIRILKDLAAWAELELNMHEVGSVLEARRKTEEKLSAQENFLRQVLDTDPNVIFVKDYNGKYVLANRALLNLYGTTVENLIGKTDADFHPNQKEVEHYLQDDRQVMDTLQPRFISEESFTDSNSSGVKWFQTIKVPLILENGKQVLGVATDITARKRAEEGLKQEKQKTEKAKVQDEAILASIGEGLIAVDNQRKIQVLNKMAEHLLGWKAQDMVGREFAGLPLLDDKNNPVPLEEKPVFKALRTGQTIHSNDYVMTSAGGVKISLGVTVTPVVLESQIVGAVIIFRDISREKEVDRAKSEFISLASHQLRTPLGIIKWYLEALQEDDLMQKDLPVAREYLDEIYTSNERLIRLVGDLLNVSRIDQQKVKNESTKCNILELTEAVFGQLKVEADKKKIKMVLINNLKSLPDIEIDQEKLREVLENLISNAVKYTSSSGQVEIALGSDVKIQIDIKDNGMGISKEDQSKIFTKFFRSKQAMQNDTTGTGLGLFIVKSYIEGWGGKIWFESEENKGTVFHISLPLMKNN